MKADLLVHNIGALATVAGPAPRRGGTQGDIGLVRKAALAALRGRIVYVGAEQDLPEEVELEEGAHVVDAEGAAAVPGFVDAHTHLVFAGDRDGEIEDRLKGATYQEIAARGGGIVATVAATRRASREELAAGLGARLDAMLLAGTTTAEVKSGYGLDLETEIKSLEAIRAAAASHPIELVPTFLGAHEVPVEHRGDRRRYVDLVVREMIPEVARRGLAEFCDVFCEPDVFTTAESGEILKAAALDGLTPRLHADELIGSGGAELAAEVGARSADHLIHVSAEGAAALARSGTAATLCPATAFSLRLGRFAPARALIDAGVPVALATDRNPGAGLTASMPAVLSLACFGMGLSLEEALCAATLNAAYSVNREREIGSLEPGKRADLVVLRSPRLLDLLGLDAPKIAHVFKDGRWVVKDGSLA